MGRCVSSKGATAAAAKAVDDAAAAAAPPTKTALEAAAAAAYKEKTDAKTAATKNKVRQSLWQPRLLQESSSSSLCRRY